MHSELLSGDTYEPQVKNLIHCYEETRSHVGITLLLYCRVYTVQAVMICVITGKACQL